MTIRKLGTSVVLALLCAASAQAGAPAEVCGDVNETNTVSSADALLVLKSAVGQPVELVCPAIKALAGCEEDLGICTGESCGDGVVNAVGEQCDGLDLGDSDCTDLSYGLGTLGCTVECKFDASGCEACPGVVYEDACWLFGAHGQSCSEVCGAAGKVYDDATRTVAGSAGTDDDCEKLLDALNAPGTGLEYGSFDCELPNGCAEEGGLRGRCATPTTTSSGKEGDTGRVCACTSECSGVAYAGACWFFGNSGQSCDEVCADEGKTYDDATRAVAGSSGTDQNCANVLDALGAPGTGLEYPSFACETAVGCVAEGNLRGRCASPVTTSSGSSEDGARACACQ